MNTKHKLGEYINIVDIRNKDLKINNLLGISVQKKFIPSIANTIGTDFTKYKIVKKRQFTYSPDTSRNGDKVSIALLEDCDMGIVSNIYTVFEVTDNEKLLPEYLMLWFSRPEFDRYARFKSHGSVREIFDWQQMCNVELVVPDIEKQKKIVAIYRIITDRIALKNRINKNLEQQAQNIFDEITYRNNCMSYRLEDLLVLLKDGTHNPPKRIENGVPLITGQTLENGFISYDKMTYISQENYEKIHKKYQPQAQDLIITKIGTVGKTAILRKCDIPITVHCNSAILRFKHEKISQFWGFWLLKSENFKKELNMRIANTVQDFVSLGQIAEIPVSLPPTDIIKTYEPIFKSVLEKMSLLNFENQRLSALRDSLLPKLMNGEIDVSEIRI